MTTTRSLASAYFRQARQWNAMEKETRRWKEFGPEGFEYGGGNNYLHQLSLVQLERRFRPLENSRRSEAGEPILQKRITKPLMRRHDTHEWLTGDIAHKTKSPEDKQAEYQAIDTMIAHIEDPQLRSEAERIAPHIKTPSASLEGHFLKAMESIDHLGVALTVRRDALIGSRNHIISPHLLVWDVLYNNVPRLLEHLSEFPSLKVWIIEHGSELLDAIDEWHSQATMSELLKEQMKVLSPKRSYPNGQEMVRTMSAARAGINELLQPTQLKLLELSDGELVEISS